jgi:hypothetical protein
MDDDLNHLEGELKRLQPARVSDRLVTRIGRELATSHPAQTRAARLTWIRWTGLPAAAAVVLLFTHFFSPSVTDAGLNAIDMKAAAPTAAAALKPVAAENLLLSALDEGLVTLSDGTTARRERLEFVDSVTWKNPATNASLTWQVPREEVRFVPVSFH